MKKFIYFCCVFMITVSISCNSSKEKKRENATSQGSEKSINADPNIKAIPEGFIDALKISLGEISQVFRNNVTEANLVKKFGPPANRTVSENGSTSLKYLFLKSGRDSGEPGFYVQGLVVVFSPTGHLKHWEITYEQFFKAS